MTHTEIEQQLQNLAVDKRCAVLMRVCLRALPYFSIAAVDTHQSASPDKRIAIMLAIFRSLGIGMLRSLGQAGSLNQTRIQAELFEQIEHFGFQEGFAQVLTMLQYFGLGITALSDSENDKRVFAKVNSTLSLVSLGNLKHCAELNGSIVAANLALAFDDSCERTSYVTAISGVLKVADFTKDASEIFLSNCLDGATKEKIGDGLFMGFLNIVLAESTKFSGHLKQEITMDMRNAQTISSLQLLEMNIWTSSPPPRNWSNLRQNFDLKVRNLGGGMGAWLDWLAERMDGGKIDQSRFVLLKTECRGGEQIDLVCTGVLPPNQGMTNINYGGIQNNSQNCASHNTNTVNVNNSEVVGAVTASGSFQNNYSEKRSNFGNFSIKKGRKKQSE